MKSRQGIACRLFPFPGGAAGDFQVHFQPLSPLDSLTLIRHKPPLPSGAGERHALHS